MWQTEGGKRYQAGLSAPVKWAHTPTPLTVIWLFISLPLVIWDAAYVLLRPHSMPGGNFHSPFFLPYALYGNVDHVYGWPAYHARDGFTAAQTSLNVVETLGYLVYLSVIWRCGTSQELGGWGRRVEGGWGATAALGGFAISVMTLSKTVLYGMNEYHSGFKHIGHNDFFSLFLLWILPNGFWILLPAYMTHTFGRDILQGLAIASGDLSSGPVRAAASLKAD